MAEFTPLVDIPEQPCADGMPHPAHLWWEEFEPGNLARQCPGVLATGGVVQGGPAVVNFQDPPALLLPLKISEEAAAAMAERFKELTSWLGRITVLPQVDAEREQAAYEAGRAAGLAEGQLLLEQAEQYARDLQEGTAPGQRHIDEAYEQGIAEGKRLAVATVRRQADLPELVHFDRPSDFRKGVLSCLMALEAEQAGGAK